MVLGQIFCRFTGSAAQTHCARRPQLVSKKFLEEIFAGTNFRELAFDRENRENFCLAKISRYTVISRLWLLLHAILFEYNIHSDYVNRSSTEHVACSCGLFLYTSIEKLTVWQHSSSQGRVV